jgi:4-amino-4-deoxychorismate lyase
MNDRSSELIDRAAAYGDGVFETIAIRDGKPRYWSAHIDRLQTSCARLDIECPDADVLSEMLSAELARSDLSGEFATARMVVRAAPSPRGYRRKSGGGSATDIGIFSANPVAKDLITNGVRTRRCNLRLAVQPALAGIKSLNRLEQVIARREWDDADIFEGLMLDTGGRLICGTMSNVFVVKEKTVVTPAITRCGVSGIMRARALQLLQQADMPCEVRDVDGDELNDANEVFLTNSQFGVLAVRAIDARQLSVGTVTRQIQDLLCADGVPECSV